MKVYILGRSDYDGIEIEAIYSSKEKAVEALIYEQYLHENDIHEFDLDPIAEGEPFEDYYCCVINPNHEEKIWIGTERINPSKLQPFEFSPVSLNTTHGYGKTPEEAESNARLAQAQIHYVWQVWNHNIPGRLDRQQYCHPSCVDNRFPELGPYAVHEDFNTAKIAVMEYQATGKLSPFLTVV